MARQKQAPTDPKAFIKEYRDGFNSNNKRPRLEDPEDNTHRAADRQYAASRATDQYTPDYEQVVLEDLTAEEQLKKLKEHLKEAKDRNLDLRARSKMVLENEVNIVRESEQEIDKLKNDLKECQQENNQVKNSTKEDQNKITLLEGLAKDHEAAGLQGVAQEKAESRRSKRATLPRDDGPRRRHPYPKNLGTERHQNFEHHCCPTQDH